MSIFFSAGLRRMSTTSALLQEVRQTVPSKEAKQLLTLNFRTNKQAAQVIENHLPENNPAQKSLQQLPQEIEEVNPWTTNQHEDPLSIMAQGRLAHLRKESSNGNLEAQRDLDAWKRKFNVQ